MERIFSKEFLMEGLELPYNAEEQELVDNNRWSLTYKIIFQLDGKYYQTFYSKGATENQCEEPWEYEDEISCTEVEKRKVEVEKWVPVEDK